MTLKVLDLFSGIGGFALALKHVAETVAYCDINEECRRVLEKNIYLKNIDDAPVFEDVTQIGRKELGNLGINMITAGFPCQDISAANPAGKGLKGERSGLFREILRIIDELGSVKVCMFENSPRILKKGFGYVSREMRKRGFNVVYCVMGARDVGALHKRARWYCLCYKEVGDVVAMKIKTNKIIFKKWDDASCSGEPKIVELKSKKQKNALLARCQMLGNAVVPQCAMYAWNCLVDGVGRGGWSKKNVDVQIVPLKRRAPLGLVFSDGVRTEYADFWHTPCRAIWHHYRSITTRGIKVLSNQLYYSVDSHTGVNKKEYINNYFSNPRFVEFLMGYPKDWTKF